MNYCEAIKVLCYPSNFGWIEEGLEAWDLGIWGYLIPFNHSPSRGLCRGKKFFEQSEVLSAV